MCLAANNLAFSSDGSAVCHRTVDLLLQANPSWLVVETDLSSAFQRASREEILFELFNRSFDGTFILRDFIPLFLTLYGEDSKLFFEDFCELWSEEGSQQGCDWPLFRQGEAVS